MCVVELNVTVKYMKISSFEQQWLCGKFMSQEKVHIISTAS
jgi:hypothetical protein